MDVKFSGKFLDILNYLPIWSDTKEYLITLELLSLCQGYLSIRNVCSCVVIFDLFHHLIGIGSFIVFFVCVYIYMFIII